MHAECQATLEGIVEILLQMSGENRDALVLLPLVSIARAC
jgi:hypothetical protein